MTTKKIFIGLLSATFVFFLVLVFNWFSLPKFERNVEPVKSIFNADREIAQTLSRVIQFKTVSHTRRDVAESADFKLLIAYLNDRFPNVHEKLELEVISNQALIYNWQGSDPSLSPIMLVAHFDVVTSGNDSEWQYEVFSGHADDEFVWGRGALDDKSALVSMFHAIDKLLESNYSPQRTVIVAFGGDEEVGGSRGAKRITDHLSKKNIKPAFILDEGMPITDGIMKGVDRPVAMIGIAEKGYVNIGLTATSTEGHSSAPPGQTAVGKLANAISKLEANPMPASFTPPVSALFDTVAREMNFLQGLVVGNHWLFESLLSGQLAKKHSTNALVRTTFASTMIEGSQQKNILPKQATATINVRILPGDSVNNVMSYIERIVDDESVKVTQQGEAGEPSGISSIDTEGFQAITNSVLQVYPEILVAPSLLIASTDSKHYKRLTNNIYRFRPVWITSDDISRFHGANERIGIKNLQQMTMFYYQLIQNSQ